MAMEDVALAELKTMLAVARRGPISFGVCLGKKPEGMVLVLHRMKPPEVLQRQAKKEGETVKTACGEIEVVGKKAMLRCTEDTPPGMPKMLKKFLAETVGMALKVVLIAADGTELESDEDELDTNAAQENKTEAAVDPRLAGLTDEIKRLAGLIGTISDLAIRAKLADALKTVVQAMKRGEVDTAVPAIDKLKAAVVRLIGAQTSDGAVGTAADEWAKAVAKTEPQVLSALKDNHPEAAKIRAVWGFAQEKAGAGDFATALAALNRLAPMLAAPKPAAQDAPPTNVVAFQRSRIMWIDTKKSMLSDLDKFQTAVLTQSSDEEDKADITAAVDEMLAEFNAFDKRLEDVLEEITVTPEGSRRSKLKKEADKAIGIYLSVLDRPFFKIVDDNPFVSVNVAARAKSSLSVIKATLAGKG